MRWRLTFLAAAAALLIAAIAYDARIATKVIASRRAAEEQARRYAKVRSDIAFRSSPEPASGKTSAMRDASAADTKSKSIAAQRRANDAELSVRQLIASDQTLRSRYLANFRDSFDVKYGLLMNMLGLSPADEARFKDLITDSEANKLEVAQMAADQGLTTDDPQMKALQKQLNGPDWQGLGTLLGTEGMTALRQYWNEWPIVTLVQDFGGNLPDSTLTLSQAQQLLPLLSAASQRNAAGVVIPNTIDVQQALASVSSVLTPDQFLMLSATLQEAEAKAQLARLAPTP